MVKVTHNFTSRTRPSAQPLAKFNVQYNPNAFGAGIGQALTGFAGALSAVQDRQQANGRFDQYVNYNDFTTSVQMKLAELKRETPLDADDYFRRAETLYTNEENKFLSGVPDQYRNEFRYRASQTRQSVLLDSYKFNFDQQDLFYSTEINDHLQQAQVEVAQNPAILTEKEGIITEMIRTSGLPELEKEKQLRIVKRALQSIAYRAEVTDIAFRSRSNRANPAATEMPGPVRGLLWAVAKGESAGDYYVRYGPRGGIKFGGNQHPHLYEQGPHGPSSAAGRYQFTWSTWVAAARGAGLDPNDFSPGNQDRAAWFWMQKTYREETGGRDLMEAVDAGDFASIRKALGRTQWAAVRAMNDEEFKAAFQEGLGASGDYAVLDSDPSFGALTFADRQQLQADGQKRADDLWSQQLATQQAAYDQQFNQLLFNIRDGQAGIADLNSFREQNPGMDFNDYDKALKMLEVKDTELVKYQTGLDMLGTGQYFTREHNEIANAMHNRGGGRQALQNRDNNFVEQQLLPQWSRMQMAGTDMVQQLKAMGRHSDPAVVDFAYGVLDSMRGLQPDAFNEYFDADTQSRMAEYRRLKPYYADPQELVNAVNDRGLDQEAIQNRKLLRIEAGKQLEEMDVPDHIDNMFDSPIPSLGLFGDVKLPLDSISRTRAEQEWNALYTQAFIKLGGDADGEAAGLADEQFQLFWGPYKGRVMRLPPDKAGYRLVNGDLSYIDKSIQRDLGLSPDDTYVLIADDLTETEVQEFHKPRRHPNEFRVPPSYQIMTLDRYGAPQNVRNPETGNIARIWFQPDRADKIIEDARQTAKLASSIDDSKRDRMNELERIGAQRLQGFDPQGGDIDVNNVINPGTGLTEEELAEYRRLKAETSNTAPEAEESREQVRAIEQRNRPLGANPPGFPGVMLSPDEPLYDGDMTADRYIRRYLGTDSKILDEPSLAGDFARKVVEFAQMPLNNPKRAKLALQLFDEKNGAEKLRLLAPPDIYLDLQISYLETLGLEHYVYAAARRLKSSTVMSETEGEMEADSEAPDTIEQALQSLETPTDIIRMAIDIHDMPESFPEPEKLGGTNLGVTTPEGRPIWQAPSGEMYSEKTITFPIEGGNQWITFPTIDAEGNMLSDQEVISYVKRNGPVDPITREVWPTFATLEEAEAYAQNRTNHRIAEPTASGGRNKRRGKATSSLDQAALAAPADAVLRVPLATALDTQVAAAEEGGGFDDPLTWHKRGIDARNRVVKEHYAELRRRLPTMTKKELFKYFELNPDAFENMSPELVKLFLARLREVAK